MLPTSLLLLLLAGSQPADPLLEKLKALDTAAAARVVKAQPTAVKEALEQSLARIDASVHSDRARPEQRRVRYDRAALDVGLRVARIYADLTADRTYVRRFAARQQRLAGTELLNDRRYRQALRPLNAALAEARALGDRWLETITRVNLAYGYLELGRAAEAVAQCEAAVEVSRSLDERAQALTLFNLGSVHLHRADAERSLTYSEQAVAKSREAGIRLWEGNALLNIGAAHFQLADLDRSRGAFDRALAVLETTKDRLGQGRALYNLALIAARQQRFAEAAVFMERALPIIRDVDIRHSHAIETDPERYHNPVERAALQLLVEAYRHLGEEEKAATYEETLRRLPPAPARRGHH